MGDHYYTPDGQMVEGLREARRLGAFPGVTTILKVFPNDGLKKYFRTCDLLSGHTTPRLPEDTDEMWLARAIQSSDDEAAKARDTGTRRHAIIEQFNMGKLKVGQHDPIDLAHCDPYFKWHTENVRKVRYAERIVVNKELGYAGTLDLDCILHANDIRMVTVEVGVGPTKIPKFVVGPSALIDVKNRKKLATYDTTDCGQLVAYSKCEGCQADKLISIVLGTERQEILIREWTVEEIDRAWKNFKLCLDLWCASKDYYPTKGAQ